MSVAIMEETSVNEVTDLGIANDGSVDVTDAINASLNEYGHFFLPPGIIRSEAEPW